MSKPGISKDTYIFSGSLYNYTTVSYVTISSSWNGSNTYSYPQPPVINQFVVGGYQSYSSDENDYHLAVMAGTCSLPLTASGTQHVFKWDYAGGTWTHVSSSAMYDWLLTNVYNPTYNDYFWQVSEFGSTSPQSLYIVSASAGIDPKFKNFLGLGHTGNPALGKGIVVSAY